MSNLPEIALNFMLGLDPARCVTEEKIACQLPCVQDLFSRKNGVKSFSDEEMPHVMESVCMPDTTRQDSVATCSSEGSLDASPLTQDGGCSVTPDNSRSCTPSSMSCLLSPISKDSRSADSSQCECKDTPPPPLTCKWKDCECEDFEPHGILEHIKSKHVDSQKGKKVSCLWEGCKVYSVQSKSRAWLEHHVVCHCGDKPFRCIVDGCSLSFTSHKLLEKHVNNHFKLQQVQGPRQAKSREDTPTKMWKRRKCRRSRPPGVKQVDFFDDGIMERIQEDLTHTTELSHIDLNGSSHSATFHSQVIAKRTDRNGKVQALLHWQPEHVIPDCWVAEKELENFQMCTIPLKRLPHPTAANLHSSIYRHNRRRKHRRK
ncbi:LOW QUALITY PROTEIN: zinc finger protein AEBP2-like [Saccostrea cucullata]|uniref:LOW QUALITY PROTEIN: zinc finger protein AEBP2-like n=1 Tax=Saccostrea cuccullata TaxID=36930 RepID=UPI002ED160C3